VNVTSARSSTGKVSRNVSTCAVVSGVTRRFSAFGSRVPSHGFARSFRSRIAERKIDDSTA
jgi:hypothetical protein